MEVLKEENIGEQIPSNNHNTAIVQYNDPVGNTPSTSKTAKKRHAAVNEHENLPPKKKSAQVGNEMPIILKLKRNNDLWSIDSLPSSGILPNTELTGDTKSTKAHQLLQIEYEKEETLDAMRIYFKQRSQIEQGDIVCQQYWTRLLIHFMTNVFKRICRSTRVINTFDNDLLASLPDNSAFSKKILITGLYDGAYKKKQMRRLAVYPNAKLTIDEISPAHILCHVHSNVQQIAVEVNFYGEIDQNVSFKIFVEELQGNINDIISGFIPNITQYYFLEPRREILDEPHVKLDIVSSASELCQHKTSFEYMISEDEKEKFKLFARHDERDSIPVQKLCLQICIDFVIDILTKVFAFGLEENYHPLKFDDSLHSKTFAVTGRRNVFYKRCSNSAGENRGGYHFKEIKKSFNMITSGPEMFNPPLHAIIHVWADGNSILIDAYNLTQNRLAINAFCREFKPRLKKLLKCYIQKFCEGLIVPIDEY